MRALSIAVIFAAALSPSSAQAGHRHCNHCGCQQHCRKVCRLICGTKKETKTEYSCECEDFCVPGRSKKCGSKCECNRLGMKCRHPVYVPVCAEVRTRRVLVKKEVEKEVPDYKWVVEEICCRCGERIDGTQQPTAGPDAAMALYGSDVEIKEPLFAAPSDIRQVSAEEEFDDSCEAATEVTMITDQPSRPAEGTPVVRRAESAPAAAKPRGLLRGLFGN